MPNGETALFAAAELGHAEVVERLLAYPFRFWPSVGLGGDGADRHDNDERGHGQDREREDEHTWAWQIEE